MKTCIQLLIISTSIHLLTAKTIKIDGCDGSFYERQSHDYNGLTRLSYLKNGGDFRIQGLLAVTETTRECNKITNFGLLRVYAMKYAIDTINKDSKLLPNYTLGLQIDNVCTSLPATMSRAMEILSQHRPDSTCRADFLKCENDFKDTSPALGIVGTKVSYSTIPLASLLSLYNIPLVSHAASSTLLTNRTNYPSFFRTMPSDKHQIRAILGVIEKFRWNYIIVIGSDDDYGRKNVEDLKKYAHDDLCIVNQTFIPYKPASSYHGITDTKIDSAISLLTKGEANKVEVVVLFLYVKDLGDKLVREAKKQGVNRIWLTSDLWNPDAMMGLQNDVAEGILTVSIYSYPMPYLVKYIKNEIRTKYECNIWLKQLAEKHKKSNCTPPAHIGDDEFRLENNCSMNISEILDLTVMPGEVYNLINSVYALAHGIHKLIMKKCSGVFCTNVKITPNELTGVMNDVSFTNQENELISFDENGDTNFAHYGIENLQVHDDGKLRYVRVGNWTEGIGLTIDKDMIKWPKWFYEGNNTKKYPFSRCNRDCQPGEYVINKKGCCWECKKCIDNQYTDQLNADNYSDCGLYQHTLDNKKCILTDVDWLRIEDAPAKALIILSAFGFGLLLIASALVIKYWKFLIVGSRTPHMITVYCIIMFVSYAFGAFHVVMPSAPTCTAMTTIFYLTMMAYISAMIIQTRFWNDYVVDGINEVLNDNLFLSHVLSLFAYLVVEAGTIFAWMHNEGLEMQVHDYKNHSPGKYLLWKQCRVQTTATRYISTFVPVIFLVIATFTSFRERHGEHCFHEPKFISFGCIALCIVVIAYLPTYHVVDLKYKAITMAIALNIFAFTYIACFFIPKIFVGVMRSKKGIELYPLRPGSEEKERKENEEESGTGENNQSPSFNSTTRTVSMTTTTNINKDEQVCETNVDDLDNKANGHVNNDNNNNNTNDDNNAIPTINEE